jgi:diguanylate cyclase (GGDEF)-like protein
MNNIESQDTRNAATDIGQLEVLIASIVEVTQQRDRVALEDCMNRVILQLTDASAMTVYHLEPKDDDMLAVPVSHLAGGLQVSPRSVPVKPFALSADAQLAERLQRSYPANLAQGTGEVAREVILPLRGSKGNVTRYCRLENARNDANTRRMLPLLLEFYTNFLTLLEDNERDALTGLLNRKTFDQRISRILAAHRDPHARAGDHPADKKFCIAALDIDHFKLVNDTFGHIYGDEVLLLFADLMKKTFRDNDLLFRFGGEEFVVLLADTDFNKIHTALERFRSIVENHQFPQIGRITVSIGACLLLADKLPRTAMDRADQALYFAKQHGRNQIRVYEELVQQGLLTQPNIQTGPIEMF